MVCGQAQVTVFVDTHATTLGHLIERVLRGALGMVLPNLDNGGTFLFLPAR
jgi:hypothetical protein